MVTCVSCVVGINARMGGQSLKLKSGMHYKKKRAGARTRTHAITNKITLNYAAHSLKHTF